ncbi:MAG: hypothetical protein WCC14_11415 [Acidobacteriaceae bacterium]
MAVVEGGITSRLARRQYAALAWMRSRIFFNSLRSARGGAELGANLLSIFFTALIAFGPSVGLGIGAYAMLVQGHPRGVVLLLWILCFVWQFFSAMAPALAGQNPEMTHLLRFPVSFGSWVLLYLFYGFLAPSTVIGVLWTIAIGVGIGIARPELLPWAAVTLAIFAFFNLLLSRTILAWVERWMSQRRSREIVTGVFLFLVLSLQLLNPALRHNRRSLPFGLHRQTVSLVGSSAYSLQKALPPGLAADAILSTESDTARVGALGWLALYTVVVAFLLGIRLRSESLGENLSEAPRRAAPGKARTRSRPLFDYPGPIAAVFEKDLRYLLRSGPLLYNLAAPLVMVFIFSSTYRFGRLSAIRMQYAFPVAIVWAFLGLTRLISNNLGSEGEGIQFYFLSPTPMRSVLLAKNLFHGALALLEAVLIGGIIVFRFGLPAPSIAAATLAWFLFALPANFAAGNALSILLPYRMNLTRMRRERGAMGNGLISMFSQFAIIGIGALVVAPFAFYGHRWLATPILLLLAAVSFAVYWTLLGKAEGMIQTHRESLAREVMKVSN